MAIIQRRVFYVKTGRANEIIATNQEFVSLVREAGISTPHRLLTDYMSGRSDRVISEIEVESVGQIEAALGQMMGNPNLAQRLGELQRRIEDAVEYSEVDHLFIQQAD